MNKKRLLTPQELHEAQAERETKNRIKGNDASFRICRRLRFSGPEHIHDWTKVDTCAQSRCGEQVIYDCRDSEGLPHICIACACKMASPTFLSGLAEDQVGDKNLNDEDSWARMQASIAQSKGGEHIREVKPRREPLGTDPRRN